MKDRRGVIDFGSSSIQIAFEPDQNVQDDINIVDMEVEEGTTRLYRASYLCFGTTEIERRSAAKLIKVFFPHPMDMNILLYV